MKRLVLAFTVLLFVSACAMHTSVAQLHTNPAKYYNKSVSVSGVVTSAFNIPLVPFHFYKVDDGTGEVTILSNRSRVPPRGARVSVTGKVNDVAMFGGRSIGLHITEEDLHVR